MHSFSDQSYDEIAPREYEIYEDNLQALQEGLRAAKNSGLNATLQPNDATDISLLNRLAHEGKTAACIWQRGIGFENFSGNFEEITGIPASMMAGEQWMMALDASHQYQAHRMLEIACEEQLPSQIMVATKSFAHMPAKTLIMEIKPSQQEDRHVVVLFYDVTVQKQLEEALTRAEISLKKANRGRSAFLSCMSHELRTPLNAIMGFSEMMREGVLGEIEHPQYAAYINHIHDSGSELLTKISTLLDIAALDSGGMAPSPRTCSLLEILEELRTLHTHSAFAAGLTIALDVTEAFDLHIDPRMLIGALSHVMANAIKYAQKDSTIHISVRPQKDDGVIIAIRDRGEGMAIERLHNIREALNAEATYFQMEGNGIGLGLSMAKELMVRQGGRVSVDSMRGQGTIVCVHIPQEAMRQSPAFITNGSSKNMPNHH